MLIHSFDDGWKELVALQEKFHQPDPDYKQIANELFGLAHNTLIQLRDTEEELKKVTKES